MKKVVACILLCFSLASFTKAAEQQPSLNGKSSKNLAETGSCMAKKTIFLLCLSATLPSAGLSLSSLAQEIKKDEPTLLNTCCDLNLLDEDCPYMNTQAKIFCENAPYLPSRHYLAAAKGVIKEIDADWREYKRKLDAARSRYFYSCGKKNDGSYCSQGFLHATIYCETIYNLTQFLGCEKCVNQYTKKHTETCCGEAFDYRVLKNCADFVKDCPAEGNTPNLNYQKDNCHHHSPKHDDDDYQDSADDGLTSYHDDYRSTSYGDDYLGSDSNYGSYSYSDHDNKHSCNSVDLDDDSHNEDSYDNSYNDDNSSGSYYEISCYSTGHS